MAVSDNVLDTSTVPDIVRDFPVLLDALAKISKYAGDVEQVTTIDRDALDRGMAEAERILIESLDGAKIKGVPLLVTAHTWIGIGTRRALPGADKAIDRVEVLIRDEHKIDDLRLLLPEAVAVVEEAQSRWLAEQGEQ